MPPNGRELIDPASNQTSVNRYSRSRTVDQHQKVQELNQHSSQQHTPGQQPQEPENGQPARAWGTIPLPAPRPATEAYGVANGPTDASAVNPGMFMAISRAPLLWQSALRRAARYDAMIVSGDVQRKDRMP